VQKMSLETSSSPFIDLRLNFCVIEHPANVSIILCLLILFFRPKLTSPLVPLLDFLALVVLLAQIKLMCFHEVKT